MKAILAHLILVTACLVTANSSANAQAFASHHGMTGADYQNKFNSYKQQGFRLVQVDGYSVGNTAYYAGIWKKVNGPAYFTHHAMTAADYQSKFNSYASQGYRLVQIDGYAVGNTVLYAGIWEKSAAAYRAHHGMTASDYQQKFNAYRSQGYFLAWISGYSVNGVAYYAAIWDKVNRDYMSHHGMTSADYQSKFNTYAGQGYRLKMVSGYNIGNTDHYAAIWEKKNGPAWSARHRMTAMGYQNEFDNHFYSGYHPTMVTGYTLNGQPTYAAIWESTSAWSNADLDHINNTVQAFMRRFDVPGVGIAIARHGKLVFAKGFGVMDKSTGEAPGPHTLFRVASVSKPVTSIAVMKMIQDNQLKIGDKVFGSGALLGTTYGAQPYSDWEKEITVQHLLEHTAGGNQWNNRGDGGAGDPMFEQTTYDFPKLIGWVLDERNPEKKPGERSDYSNFGYCVLGRIVEKKSGQTYENYVKDKVLKPCGIHNMHIGADTKAGRRYNEAVYYDNDDPYGMKVARMDAHGGWIASPVDLVRLLVRADGFATKPDILTSTSFTTMTTPSSVDNGYAKGWAVNGTNYFHNGSLPGTGAIIVRTGGGFTWALVMNARWKGQADGLMWDIVNGITTWPAHDWF